MPIHNFCILFSGFKKMSEENDDCDYMFKILIIGNTAVGKTAALVRYTDDTFTDVFISTVGIDFKVKLLTRYYVLIMSSPTTPLWWGFGR